MKRWLRPGWLAVYFVLFVGWAAWYVPKLNAERYRGEIQSHLESALGRKVSFSTIEFRLLPVPGFTITNLNIGEDPAIGPEPAAYITTLRGRPRLSALFGGPMEFASVDLEEASVNLTRAEGDSTGVRWNFSALTRSQLKASFPVIHMLGGRVNFKFGDTKTVFYLLNTDADLWPPSEEGGPWTMKVQAEPARTDRPSHGFGSFVARGEWRPRDGILTIDAKLEKSELSDVATLFQGSESELHGRIWGEAHLSGPADRVGIAGKLNIDDIHGWNQPPSQSSKPFALVLSGALDARNQTLDMRANSSTTEFPFDLRYRVQSFLGRPRWAVTALLEGTPLAPLAEVARHMGSGIPDDWVFEGSTKGVLGYSSGMNPTGAEAEAHFDGGLTFTGVKAVSKNSGTLSLSDTSLTVSGSKAILAPATLTSSSGETAVLDAALDSATSSAEVGLKTDKMAVETLRPLLAASQLPLLSRISGGTWSGNLRYTGTAGRWTGDLHVKDSSLRFEAFAEPVQLLVAEAQLDDTAATVRQLSLKVAGMDAQGDYRYEYGAEVPHQIHLTATTADGAALEKLLEPALSRGGLLNKTLNFGKVPTPEWLHNLRVGGTLQINSLALGALTATRLKSRVEWSGESVVLPGLTAQLANASLTGTLAIDLTGAQPRYDFTGKGSGLGWRNGLLEAEGTATTVGSGSDILSRLALKGTFSGRNLEVITGHRVVLAQGPFELAWGKNSPSITSPGLTATVDGGVWTGTLETKDNGEVALKLTSGERVLQATGAVFRGDPLVVAPAAK